MNTLWMWRGLYRGLLFISLPLALLRLLWKSRKNPAYRQRFAERLAWRLPDCQAVIWLHTVSVGEFLATLPLIEQLLADGEDLLITTTTPTGSAMVREKLGQRVAHSYLPFDVAWMMRRFIGHVRPRVAVFMETEIWPQALQTLKTRQCPALLINARLSEKSFNGYAKLGIFARDSIASFAEIACQNQASQTRFVALGGQATLLGNLKFDLSAPADLADKQAQLRRRLGKRHFIVAASTHKGEEDILLTAYQRNTEQRLLVIAPRHPERSSEIATLASKNGITALRYSDTDTLTADTQVLIVDTLGQLLTFYSLADYAIIGGSFVPHGGHNPLEAALFATPCQIGPSIFNFDSLIGDMQAENAIERITAEQLFTQAPAAKTGENARHFLAANQGAVAKYRALILQKAKAQS